MKVVIAEMRDYAIANKGISGFVESRDCFTEGNGRSLQVFMKQLAREQGVELDYTKALPAEWNHACAVSGTHGRRFENILIPQKPDAEPIKKLFAQIARPAANGDLDKQDATN